MRPEIPTGLVRLEARLTALPGNHRMHIGPVAAVLLTTAMLGWMSLDPKDNVGTARPPAGNVDRSEIEFESRLPFADQIVPQPQIELRALVQVRPALGPTSDVVAPTEGSVVAAGSVHVQVHESLEFGRALRPGDRVAKGQVLATIWSVHVGETKSHFLAAVSRRLFDEASLARLRAAQAPKAAIAEVERHLRRDMASLTHAEQALRELGFVDDQIKEIRDAASLVHQGQPDYRDAERWAELELRAPHDGVVVRAEALIGNNVRPGVVLFQIAEQRPVALTGATDESERLAESEQPR